MSGKIWKKIGLSLTTAGGVILILWGWQATPVHAGPHKDSQHPFMESALAQLNDVYLTQGLRAARRFAGRRGVLVQGGMVQVVVEAAQSGTDIELQASAAMAGRAVMGLGGRVEVVHRNMVQNMIPLGSLQALAENAAVRFVRLPLRPIPLATSEGVARVGADRWHSIPTYRNGGEAPVVCVLDLGFQGYESLLGGELPVNTEAVSFRTDGDIAAGTPHGTACAEIVHDMAPDAKLILVNYSTDVEHHNAVEWIINRGVDIISYSLGWLSAGAGDGTGPICEDVKKAHQAGIVWVSAAGNSGRQHWHGRFRDRNQDGWLDFDAAGSKDSDYFSFWVDKGDRFSVWINWDDWGSWNGSRYVGSDGNDYDLYLYDKNKTLVDSSTYRQNKGAVPIEGLVLKAKAKGRRYLRIKKYGAVRDCRMEIFIVNASELEHVVPYGSINVPADSSYALSVGATDWAGDFPHSYTSLGPTSDQRIKPDLTAPAGVSTHTYGKFTFFGTSASAAHVAGAIALIKGKTPYSLDQVLQLIKVRAIDLGAAGKDNLFGDGRLELTK
jgi:hypothetical protein